MGPLEFKTKWRVQGQHGQEASTASHSEVTSSITACVVADILFQRWRPSPCLSLTFLVTSLFKTIIGSPFTSPYS